MKENFGKMLEHSANACARAEDLIAYLYNESSEREASDFKRHLDDCASCRAELSAFAGVRDSVGLWRQQVLSAFEASESNTSTTLATDAPAHRSALRALREFFSLSPVSMQAATALATLAFIALIVVAVLHFSRSSNESALVAQPQTEPGYTQKQVDEMIADARRQEREAAGRSQSQTSQAGNTTVANIKPNNQVARDASVQRTNVPKPMYIARNTVHKKSVRPLTPQEFNEIIRGYQLTAANDEERLPRLSDLLRDANGSNE